MRTAKYSILCIIVAALGIYTFTMRYRDIEEPPPPDLALVPEEIAGYHGSDNFLEPTSLAVLGADETLFRTFIRGDEPPIWLFLGYFGAQQEHSQIHSPKRRLQLQSRTVSFVRRGSSYRTGCSGESSYTGSARRQAR
jgi:hypothetical protein